MMNNNILKRFSLCIIIIISLITLSSCKISEDYAKKINDAYASGNPITYNEICSLLGKSFDMEVTGTPDTATGSCCWFKGYGKSEAEGRKCMDDIRNGKKIKSLTVKFENGNAVQAWFYIFNDDKK